MTKTLRRDLAAVEEMGLVERKAEGVRAKREVIPAFLPLCCVNNEAQVARPTAPKEEP